MILRRFFGNPEQNEARMQGAREAGRKAEGEKSREFIEQNFPHLEGLAYPGKAPEYGAFLLQELRNNPELWSSTYEDVAKEMESLGIDVKGHIAGLSQKKELTDQEQKLLARMQHLSPEASDLELGMMIDFSEKIRQFIAAGLLEDYYEVERKLRNVELQKGYRGEVKEGLGYELSEEDTRSFLEQVMKNPRSLVYKMQAMERACTSPFVRSRNMEDKIPERYYLARERLLRIFPASRVDYGTFG